MKSVFIDADALIALARLRDKNHLKAKKIYKQLTSKNVSFVTSNTSLYEMVTVISQRISHKKAKELFSKISQSLSTFFIDLNLQEKAMAIFSRQRSKNVSFFDCLNMAILKELGLQEIFSFDEDYKKNGFLRIRVDQKEKI